MVCHLTCACAPHNSMLLTNRSNSFLPFILPIFFVVLFGFDVHLFALLAVAQAEESAEPVVLLGMCLGLLVLVFLDDACQLLGVVLHVAVVGRGVVVEDGAGVVVEEDTVVGVAEGDHADGAFLAEAHTMAVAVAVEDDGHAGAVDADGEEGGLELEVSQRSRLMVRTQSLWRIR